MKDAPLGFVMGDDTRVNGKRTREALSETPTPRAREADEEAGSEVTLTKSNADDSWKSCSSCLRSRARKAISAWGCGSLNSGDRP